MRVRRRLARGVQEDVSLFDRAPLPFGLAWVLLTGAIIVLPQEIGRRATITAFAIGFGALVVVSLIWPLIVRRPEEVRAG